MRPVLVALSARAAGEMNDSLVTVATIIEMVHLASLVHDDVMDEAEIRRRRADPTRRLVSHEDARGRIARLGS